METCEPVRIMMWRFSKTRILLLLQNLNVNYRALLLALLSYVACAILLLSAVAAIWFNAMVVLQLLAVAVVLLALRTQFSQRWNPFAFSLWVLAVVLQAFCTPVIFQQWPIGPANSYVLRLIQIIMFAMGMTLSFSDFVRVFVEPRKVGIGMLLQFTVMPLTGWAVARALALPPEIAVGVVLIGACPGGVASNVITYIARGDVALSVTMTACSTLAAPLMTPLAMQLLAGSNVDVSFKTMGWSILEMTIIPVAAGLLISYILQALRWKQPSVDRMLSIIAMIAICLVIGIIVAQSRSSIAQVGLSLFIAAVLHNAIGYALGYGGAKVFKLDEKTSRTIAIEVGMQNGGLASALATEVLKSPPAAISGAIFGAWMSVSGSVLASWWRRRDELRMAQQPETVRVVLTPREVANRASE